MALVAIYLICLVSLREGINRWMGVWYTNHVPPHILKFGSLLLQNHESGITIFLRDYRECKIDPQNLPPRF